MPGLLIPAFLENILVGCCGRDGHPPVNVYNACKRIFCRANPPPRL